MKTKKICVLTFLILISLLFFNNTFQEDNGIVAWWNFDSIGNNLVVDLTCKVKDSVSGNFKVTRGVKDNSIRLDGFTTRITREASRAPNLSGTFTIEAWIALAAYPWNWCPIITQADEEKAGYSFGIGPRGEFGIKVSVDGKWQKCLSEDFVIPLKKWVHVACVFDAIEGITLYLNGRKAGNAPVKGNISFAKDSDLLIGMNYKKVKPSHPVRPFGTLPAWYSLDGNLDEIKIYDRAVQPGEIANSYKNHKPDSDPEFQPRIMPSGPKGPGKFGAYYCKLKFYEEWDALWRTEDHPDIVVQFDNSPVRVVFWRGTRYSPAWVMENGLWMADQSAEGFTDTEGCYEHMLDAHCRFSHVRIIENTDARVVIHWRYIPVSVYQSVYQTNEKSGWSDTADEYYTFYPDGIGIRKVVLKTSGDELHPSEMIALCQQGTKPEDVVELEALTLVNMKGESQVFSWAKETPDLTRGTISEKPNIALVNYKSRYKPFEIFEPGCNIRVFDVEIRKGVSQFPWWNHWPVAQIPSDGRYCQTSDRASHFSLAWGRPVIHKGKGILWASWMYGATKDSPEELVPLARSWAYPPELRIEGDNYVSEGYDFTQRAYIINAENSGSTPLKFTLNAGEDSPVVNCAFVIKNWGDFGARISVNGKDVTNSKEIRTGYLRKLDGTDLIVWIEGDYTKPVNMVFSRMN